MSERTCLTCPKCGETWRCRQAENCEYWNLDKCECPECDEDECEVNDCKHAVWSVS